MQQGCIKKLKNEIPMIVYVFDLAISNQDSVKEVVNLMAHSGVSGGIYLWLNNSNGKVYVGSTLNLKRRMKTYFGLKQLHGIIGKALKSKALFLSP